MQKYKDLNRWFWRWHIIAGLITLPVILLLSIIGMLYLFKEDYNNTVYNDMRFVSVPKNAQSRVSYTQQLAAVNARSDLMVTEVVLPSAPEDAVAFRLHGKKGDHTRNYGYTNPYTGEVNGFVSQRNTLMYTVRKLHG